MSKRLPESPPSGPAFPETSPLGPPPSPGTPEQRETRQRREQLAQQVERDQKNREQPSSAGEAARAADEAGLPPEAAAAVGGLAGFFEKIGGFWEKAQKLIVKLWKSLGSSGRKFLEMIGIQPPEFLQEALIPGEIQAAMEAAGLKPIAEQENDMTQVEVLKERFSAIPANQEGRPATFRDYYLGLILKLKENAGSQPPHTIAQLVEVSTPETSAQRQEREDDTRRHSEDKEKEKLEKEHAEQERRIPVILADAFNEAFRQGGGIGELVPFGATDTGRVILDKLVTALDGTTNKSRLKDTIALGIDGGTLEALDTGSFRGGLYLNEYNLIGDWNPVANPQKAVQDFLALETAGLHPKSRNAISSIQYALNQSINTPLTPDQPSSQGGGTPTTI